MIRQGDTATYYNANPLSSASRIVLSKQVPGKMFVYGGQGQLLDSVPLKTGKYTTLLNEKEDVFLLYRGWLELQCQQAIAGKEEVTRLLNREFAMLYKPVYWEQNKEQLQHTLLEVEAQIDAIGSKVIGLIMPSPEETAQLLATVYQDKPAEISYMPGLGFAYSIAYTRGNKRYELTDHRGNVIAVSTDKKKGVDDNGDGMVDYYNADVVSAVDYFPFGSMMPGRAYTSGEKYRYGFNGKENDNEVKGEGNQQDYGMRIYDPRVGRFLSVDPLTKSYPMLTPYQFASNSPISNIDVDGLEKIHFSILNQNGKPQLSQPRVEHFTESRWVWNPSWSKKQLWESQTVTDPRKEYVLHGTGKATYGIDGNVDEVKSLTWTFSSYGAMNAALHSDNPMDLHWWSSDQQAEVYSSTASFNSLQAEFETGGMRGLWAGRGLRKGPAISAGEAAISVHDGNAGAAKANTSQYGSYGSETLDLPSMREVKEEGGRVRAANYGEGWQGASLSEAIDRFAPGATGRGEGGKTVYSGEQYKVIYDNGGNYFRIEQKGLTGKRRFTDLNGTIPNNRIENGRTVGRAPSEYNKVTHFNNTDSH